MSGTWIPRPALDLVRKWEGLYRVGTDGLVYPYLCPAGVWTIGWGTTKGITKDTKPWTKAECDLRMVQDLARFTLDVYRLCPAILDASDNRIGASVSWTYNLGPGNLAASTFRKRINTQDWKAAGIECRKWNMAGGIVLAGLVARRELEATYIERG